MSRNIECAVARATSAATSVVTCSARSVTRSRCTFNKSSSPSSPPGAKPAKKGGGREEEGVRKGGRDEEERREEGGGQLLDFLQFQDFQ